MHNISSSSPEIINLEEQLIPFSDHYQNALYGRYGYYMAGTVKFLQHFDTNGTKGFALGMLLCEHMHLLYEAEMRENKRIVISPSPFRVVELSGGNGRLAYNTLEFLEELANEKVGLYPHIWRDIQYTIYEISPALVQQQTTLCQQQITLGKLIIKNSSALNIRQERGVSFCFSNELWDVLPVDLIQLDENGKAHIIVCLPTVAPSTAQQIKTRYAPLLKIEEIEISQSTHAILSRSAPLKPLKPSWVILNKTTIRKIETRLSKNHWDIFLKNIDWIKQAIPLEHFPLIYSILTSSGYLATLDKGPFHVISSTAMELIRAINECNPLAQAHWDYGLVLHGGVRDRLTCYGENIVPHTPYDFQSNVDITYRVDFKMLATMLSRDPVKQKNYLEDVLITFQVVSTMIIKEGIFKRTEGWHKIMVKRGKDADRDMFRYFGESAVFCVLYISKYFLPTESFDAQYPATPKDYPESPVSSVSKGLPLTRKYKPTNIHGITTTCEPIYDLHCATVCVMKAGIPDLLRFIYI